MMRQAAGQPPTHTHLPAARCRGTCAPRATPRPCGGGEQRRHAGSQWGGAGCGACRWHALRQSCWKPPAQRPAPSATSATSATKRPAAPPAPPSTPARGSAPHVAGEGGRVELGAGHGAVGGAPAVEHHGADARLARLQHGVPHVAVAAAAGEAGQQDEEGGVVRQRAVLRVQVLPVKAHLRGARGWVGKGQASRRAPARLGRARSSPGCQQRLRARAGGPAGTSCGRRSRSRRRVAAGTRAGSPRGAWSASRLR
jgi:hypothetical protein